MSLVANVNSLATRIATEFKSVRTALAGKAASSHTHVATTDLTATGTKDNTTYLRGDNTWNTPPASIERVAIVDAASTANIALSGVQTVDTVSLTVGAVVLVKSQTTSSQNGIYIVQSGAWTRHSSWDVAAEIAAAVVRVTGGATNGGTLWTTTFKSTDTVDVTAMSWYALITDKGAWTPYTSAVSGFNSVLGNGTCLGRYRMLDSKTCQFTVTWGIGSTSAVGVVVNLDAPFTATSAINQSCAGAAYDASSGVNYGIGGFVQAGSKLVNAVGNGGRVASGYPFAWAVNDQMILSGIYEIA